MPDILAAQTVSYLFPSFPLVLRVVAPPAMLCKHNIRLLPFCPLRPAVALYYRRKGAMEQRFTCGPLCFYSFNKISIIEQNISIYRTEIEQEWYNYKGRGNYSLFTV